MLHVIFYTKANCSLCWEVESILEDLACEFDFLLEKVDITADLDLYERYRETIPVVIVASTGGLSRTPVTLASRITEGDLRRALALSTRPKRNRWSPHWPTASNARSRVFAALRSLIHRPR